MATPERGKPAKPTVRRVGGVLAVLLAAIAGYIAGRLHGPAVPSTPYSYIDDGVGVRASGMLRREGSPAARQELMADVSCFNPEKGKSCEVITLFVVDADTGFLGHALSAIEKGSFEITEATTSQIAAKNDSTCSTRWLLIDRIEKKVRFHTADRPCSNERPAPEYTDTLVHESER